MAEDLWRLIRGCAKSARSQHVVGAGIGARRAKGCSNSEPRLTLLVDRDVPKEQLLAAVRQVNGGKEVDFDVLEVGDVRALGRLHP